MANQLMEVESKFVVNGEEVKLTGNIVKSYLTHGNEGVSDQEVVMFMNLCKYQKLNPFLNEAYLVKFKGSPAQIITSKEAYMKKAERNEDFEGLRAGLIVQRNNAVEEIEGAFSLGTDKVVGGWAEVYKKNRKFPYIAKVNIDEYDKGQSTWKQKPKTMIRKVAIVQALREAFPEDLGAMYVEEEQSKPIDASYEVNEEIKGNANKKPLDIQEQPKDEVKQGQQSFIDVNSEKVKNDQTPNDEKGGPAF